MANPFLKFIKKEGQIQVTVDGDMRFDDIALGIFTYLEEVSKIYELPEEKVKQAFVQLLDEIGNKIVKGESENVEI